MERVTGIGGVFFKAKDPKALAAWYEKHLGIAFGGQSYATFSWKNDQNPEGIGETVFSFFKQDSDYFAPSTSPFMINFRVKDLDAVLAVLKEEGIAGEKAPSEEYGKFGWIFDPEGNKIELWQPMD
jgi:predicted enzyme related to lactoylglutathione lyase